MNQSSQIRASLYQAIFVVFLLTGCCSTRHKSPFTDLSPEKSRALAQQLALQRDQELQADLRSAFANHPPKNILILSGGDAQGAFGCGILNGWRNAPSGRPKFDIVTGVSTGAFIATFAFLGEEQDDASGESAPKADDAKKNNAVSIAPEAGFRSGWKVIL